MQTLEAFTRQVAAVLPPAQIIQDRLKRITLGTDASFYRLEPALVLQLDDEMQLQQVLAAARDCGVGLTFRAAGTSLSGQAITEQVLLVLTSKWQNSHILDQGLRLQAGCMLRGGDANLLLQPYGRMIAPVPASIASATIGGIASNNASGMNALDTYAVLDSMRLVLADGTVLDTADPQNIAAFRQSHAGLLSNLAALSQALLADEQLTARIRRKYQLKNTTGYGLRALLDYADPIQMLCRLMIGSEGTLGFISSVTQHTIALDQHSASAFVLFQRLTDAGDAVQLLATLGRQIVGACELIDESALRAVANQAGVPAILQQLPAGGTALLIQTGAADAAELQRQIARINAALAGFALLEPLQFSSDAAICQGYWQVRKGIFPAVGATRPIGTTAIIEDVCYPVERLTEALTALRLLLDQHGYADAVIYGHALDGNIHFIFAQGFASAAEIARYQQMIEAVVAHVVDDFDGSLKAEHGTGRNMAPFVRREWGDTAYQAMLRIKQLLDPQQILNPGVLINSDALVYLKNIKPMPQTDPLIDQCIECGFCERVCPSRQLTMTPRQRIVARREIASQSALLDQDGIARLGADLLQNYDYQAIKTCAACGLCATVCPVGINTGDLTRQIRANQNQAYQHSAERIATHFAKVSQGTRLGLRLGHWTQRLLGGQRLHQLSKQLQQRLSGLPLWLKQMPQAATALAAVDKMPGAAAVDRPKVVYFASCASRVMGPAVDSTEQRSLPQITLNLLDKAGFNVILPPALEDLCCGMPFQSKGQFAAAEQKAGQLAAALWLLSEQGQIPILFDTSPCTMRLKEQLTQWQYLYPEALPLYEPAAFALQYLLPRLAIKPQAEPVALHITCSSRKMGLADLQLKLLRQLADNVVLPLDISCCGFAGDKGFTVPELNASALAPLRQQVSHCHSGYSTSRTCEIGLAEHSGINYLSVLSLLDKVSTAKVTGPN